MTLHALYTLIGWTAVLIGLASTVAQFRRAFTIGIEGISLATWVMFVMLGGYWITYGAVVHSWIISLGSLCVLPLQLAIIFRLQPWKRWNVSFRCLVFFASFCIVPTLLWGWNGGVLGVGLAMVGNRLPQIIKLVRYRGADGVSVGAWSLGVLCSSTWMVYYVGFHLWSACIATASSGAANVTVALLASWRHRQSRENMIREVVFAV